MKVGRSLESHLLCLKARIGTFLGTNPDEVDIYILA